MKSLNIYQILIKSVLKVNIICSRKQGNLPEVIGPSIFPFFSHSPCVIPSVQSHKSQSKIDAPGCTVPKCCLFFRTKWKLYWPLLVLCSDTDAAGASLLFIETNLQEHSAVTLLPIEVSAVCGETPLACGSGALLIKPNQWLWCFLTSLVNVLLQEQGLQAGSGGEGTSFRHHSTSHLDSGMTDTSAR